MTRRKMLSAIALGLCAGCGGTVGTGVGVQLPEVVCTTGMVADLARQVGGPHVRVSALMGEGVDPHLFKVAPGDIRRLYGADLVLFSGLHLEGKMGDVLARMRRRRPTVAVTERIPSDRLLRLEGGHPDPHLWFDVGLWSLAVDVVRDALIGLDPAHASEFRKAAAAYRARLDRLDAEVRERFQSLRPDRRVLVTAHDAFGYLARAYGLEVHAIQGLSTESEAGLHEINALVDLLVERKIPAVFVESSVSERNLRSLIQGSRARGHDLVIGGELFSDAMGRDGTPEGTYEGMVRHNVDTITRALQ